MPNYTPTSLAGMLGKYRVELVHARDAIDAQIKHLDGTIQFVTARNSHFGHRGKKAVIATKLKKKGQRTPEMQAQWAAKFRATMAKKRAEREAVKRLHPLKKKPANRATVRQENVTNVA